MAVDRRRQTGEYQSSVMAFRSAAPKLCRQPASEPARQWMRWGVNRIS